MREAHAGGLRRRAACVVALTIGASIGFVAPRAEALTPGTADAVRTNLVVNGIVYDPGRDVIYASVDETDVTYPNKIVTIDPVTRAVVASASAGTQPGSLAVSDDGTALFVGIDGQSAVKKLALPAMTVSWSTTFGEYLPGYPMTVGDIAVLPGSNDSIAVARRVGGLSPEHAGVVVIDGGVTRPDGSPGHTGSNEIAFDPDGVRLYGAGTGSGDFYTNIVGPTGITERTQFGSGGGGGEIVYDDGFVYSGTGVILDVTGATPVLSDTLTSGGTFGNTSVAVDPAANRVYYTVQGYAGTLSTTIVSYDLTTREPVASWRVAPHAGFSDRLIMTGQERLAYIDANHPAAREGRLVLVAVGATATPPPTTPPTTPPPTTPPPTTPPPTTPPPTSSAEGEYTPLTPQRILDTRSGLGRGGAIAPVGPGQTIDVAVTGVGGVPTTGVSAVVVNVTAVFPTDAGYLTVFPTGMQMPTISNLNFSPGSVVPNLVTMPVGAGGKVSVYNPFGNVDVLFDIAGYYAGATGTQGLRFHAITPTRFMDTRNGTGGRLGALGAADTANLQVSGLRGVPAGARAVALNVTVTGTTSPGFVSIYPSDVSKPVVSNLNFGPDATIANQAIVRVPPNGVLSIYNELGATDVIVDVVGWYDTVEVGDKGRFIPAVPDRVIDTRRDSPFAPPGFLRPGNILFTADTEPLTAYVLNVTVAETQGAGFVTVFPYTAGAQPPTASNVNYAPGRTVPNHVIAPAGPSVGFYNAGGATHLIVDVFGAFL